MIPYHEIREKVAEAGLMMHNAGLIVATCGNVSARIPDEDIFAITPSSMPYPEIQAQDVVVMDMEGNVISSDRPPSFESNLHRRIYQLRPDIGSIYHTHSTYASVLAVLRKPLPPILEEMIIFLGGTVEVAEYAPGGSDELIENACNALGDRAAVLLANHGPICVGKDLEHAFYIAQLVEQASQIYLLSLSIGTPFLLPEEVQNTQRAIYDYLRTNK